MAETWLAELELSKSKWITSIVNPYTRAYVEAYRKYEEKLKEENEHEESMVTMFILAASVLSGTVMMAVFATASLRALAGAALLSFVCNNNLERTFNLMAWTASKGPLMFAIGALFDKAGDKIAEMAKKRITGAFEENPNMIQGDAPLVVRTYLIDFVEKAYQAALRARSDIEENKRLSAAERQSLVVELKSASFNNPPPDGVVIEPILRDKMELSFYLASIINSATLFTGTFTTDQAFVPWRQTHIDKLPSDPTYPESRFRYPSYQGEVVVNTRVEIKSLGSVIRKRVDELHRQYLGGNFYMVQNNVTNREDLMRAQRALERLADGARPMLALPFRI